LHRNAEMKIVQEAKIKEEDVKNKNVTCKIETY
jgi:hypothetical protein